MKTLTISALALTMLTGTLFFGAGPARAQTARTNQADDVRAYLAKYG